MSSDCLFCCTDEAEGGYGEREIPKYEPGHLSRMDKVKPLCSYAGWGFSGVSITHVVDESERIADLF